MHPKVFEFIEQLQRGLISRQSFLRMVVPLELESEYAIKTADSVLLHQPTGATRLKRQMRLNEMLAHLSRSRVESRHFIAEHHYTAAELAFRHLRLM